MNTLLALLVLAIVLAIFATTTGGQRIMATAGLRRFVKGAAPEEDRDYLLRACGGDRDEVRRRLEDERARNDSLDEAQLYRKAIRRVVNERKGES